MRAMGSPGARRDKPKARFVQILSFRDGSIDGVSRLSQRKGQCLADCPLDPTAEFEAGGVIQVVEFCLLV